MEIVAKTKDSYLIQAKESEIKEILCAVIGEKPKDLLIGQKIPAIDYATTITKIKTLGKDYHFLELFKELEQVNEKAVQLRNAVENASKIEI